MDMLEKTVRQNHLRVQLLIRWKGADTPTLQGVAAMDNGRCPPPPFGTKRTVHRTDVLETLPVSRTLFQTNVRTSQPTFTAQAPLLCYVLFLEAFGKSSTVRATSLHSNPPAGTHSKYCPRSCSCASTSSMKSGRVGASSGWDLSGPVFPSLNLQLQSFCVGCATCSIPNPLVSTFGVFALYPCTLSCHI